MPVIQTGKQKTLPFRVPKEGVAGYRKLYEILSFIFHKLGFKLSFDGMDGEEIHDGIHLRALNSATIPPFTCSLEGAGLLVTPGTYNSVYPTLGGTSIAASPAPHGTLLTGTSYVYLKLVYTLDSTADGYVYGSTLSTATIEITGSAASTPLGPTTGTYYVLLATFSDGAKTGQPIANSLTGEVCDSGALNDTANLTTFAT